jgi:hypothetical protein
MSSLNNRMSTDDIFKIVKKINVNRPNFVNWLFIYNSSILTLQYADNVDRDNAIRKVYRELTAEHQINLYTEYYRYLTYRYISSDALLKLISWYKRRKLKKVNKLLVKNISRTAASIISQYL